MKMRKREAICQDQAQLVPEYQAGEWTEDEFRKQLEALAKEPLSPRKRHCSDANSTVVLDDNHPDNESVDGN